MVEENKGTNNIKGDVYFVENESWGEVIYNIFRQMEQEKKAYTALEIHSPGHTMALGIKIKTIKKISLLLISMIPIRLRLINEYFFCTKNIIDVRKLTAYDFLSEACLKCYGLKEETLSLFVDKTKSIENNNVSIKKLPDNLLQSVVINFAMGGRTKRDNQKDI
ncbi:ShET2/EspL2 family type III secretion system effector toxin [Escherichia albertii]|nr:ShET2/EspL2 family type III secretion system effector toxin [Escherichia albertii]